MDQRVTVPQNLEAEQYVLGGCMAFGESVPEVGGVLNATDFYRRAHQAIWQAILELHGQGEACDPLLVRQWIVQHDPEETPSSEYLWSLADYVPSAVAVPSYARIVRDQALRRRLQSVGHRLIYEIADPDREALEHVDAVRGEMEALLSAAPEDRGLDMNRGLDEIYAEIQRAIESGTSRDFRLHIPELDKRLALTRSSLLVIAAREGVGKSFLAQWSSLVNAQARRPVEIVTTEMPGKEYIERMLETWAQVGRAPLKDPRDETDLLRVERGMRQLRDLPVHFIEEESADVALRTAHQRAAQHKPCMLLVDYFQRLTFPREWGEGDTARIKEGARRFKNFANRHEVPVVLLSSVTRPAKGEEGKFPQLSDIYGGQAINHEADAILFMHRRNEMNGALTEFRVSKGRHARDRRRWFMQRRFDRGVFEEVEFEDDAAA